MQSKDDHSQSGHFDMTGSHTGSPSLMPFEQQGQLPSIYALVPDLRRSSTTSLTSTISSSGSTPACKDEDLLDCQDQGVALRRLKQIDGHVAHRSPDPNLAAFAHLSIPDQIETMERLRAESMSLREQVKITGPRGLKPKTQRSKRGVAVAKEGSTEREKIKAGRETNARKKLSECFASLYNEFLKFNGDMLQLGTPTPGQHGLRPLKSNNIDAEIKNAGKTPLLCNKEDAINLSSVMLCQLRRMGWDTVQFLRDNGFEAESQRLAHGLSTTGTGGYEFAALTRFKRPCL